MVSAQESRCVPLLKLTNLWVELLFCSGVTILTSLSSLALTGIPPFLTLFHSWTWQRSLGARRSNTTTLLLKQQPQSAMNNKSSAKKGPFPCCNWAPVFVLVRAAPPVFAVVVIWTGVTLTAQTRRFLTEFCLVVGEHIVVIYGVKIHKLPGRKAEGDGLSQVSR